MNVNQILVTGPRRAGDGGGAAAINTIEDLSGKEVFAPRIWRLRRKPPRAQRAIQIAGQAAGGHPRAPAEPGGRRPARDGERRPDPGRRCRRLSRAFWKKVFRNLIVHDSITLHSGGTLAIAVRKNNPHLLAALNTFMGSTGWARPLAIGSTETTSSTRPTRECTSVQGRQRSSRSCAVSEVQQPVQRGLSADGRAGIQESRLNQYARSPVGAIGIMQIMPATGTLLKVGDITELEPNIHAGVKHMRSVRMRTSRTSR